MSITSTKGLFVVGAIDNINHNSTSTFSLSSFHGTGISNIQFPDSVVNDDENNETIFPDIHSAIRKVQLPISYTTVPAVSLNVNKCQVPAVICDENLGNSVNDAVEQKNNWIKHGMHEHVEMITWAACHANHQRPALIHPALTAMLPLFVEKSDIPAMIMHGMTVIKSITEYLHPGQVPIMACDCPVLAKAKFV